MTELFSLDSKILCGVQKCVKSLLLIIFWAVAVSSVANLSMHCAYYFGPRCWFLNLSGFNWPSCLLMYLCSVFISDFFCINLLKTSFWPFILIYYFRVVRNMNEKEIGWKWWKLWLKCIDEDSKRFAPRHGRCADPAWVTTSSSYEEANVDYCLGFIRVRVSSMCLYLPTKKQFCLLHLFFWKLPVNYWLASTSSCKGIHRWRDCITSCY